MHLKKYNERVIINILKRIGKSEPIFIRFDNKWHNAHSCLAKTKNGVRYNRLSRLIRKIQSIK